MPEGESRYRERMPERVQRRPTFARDGLDASALQKPYERQPLGVVVQTLAVSVHEEGFYVSTRQHFRSLNQILSQLPRYRGVENDVARVAEDSGFEELRLPNDDRAGLQIDIAQIQARKFAQSQPCAVGKHQHAAKIRAAETRKQKHDRRDARLILDLLVMEDRFPEIWMRMTHPILDSQLL